MNTNKSLDVGRTSARHACPEIVEAVGLKPDLQPINFVMPQRLLNNLK